MSRRHRQIAGARWEATRRAVFERDGWRCTSCGRVGRLECDHVTPLEREPEQDPFDMNGLQTLCRSCHLAKTASENRKPETPGMSAWRALVNDMLHGPFRGGHAALCYPERESKTR